MATEQEKPRPIVEKTPALSHSEDEEVAERLGLSGKVGTRTDHRDMIRMGKRQELDVRAI